MGICNLCYNQELPHGFRIYCMCVKRFDLKICQQTSEVIVSPFAANMLSISYGNSRHRGYAEFCSLLQHRVGRAKVNKTSLWDGESVKLDPMAFIIDTITIYHGSVHAVAKAS